MGPDKQLTNYQNTLTTSFIAYQVLTFLLYCDFVLPTCSISCSILLTHLQKSLKLVNLITVPSLKTQELVNLIRYRTRTILAPLTTLFGALKMKQIYNPDDRVSRLSSATSRYDK